MPMIAQEQTPIGSNTNLGSSMDPTGFSETPYDLLASCRLFLPLIHCTFCSPSLHFGTLEIFLKFISRSPKIASDTEQPSVTFWDNIWKGLFKCQSYQKTNNFPFLGPCISCKVYHVYITLFLNIVPIPTCLHGANIWILAVLLLVHTGEILPYTNIEYRCLFCSYIFDYRIAKIILIND